ncbi:transcription factor S [Candidatus Woesearchaeota archaeon]|nr:transcription factor S [Candidatus Woesearchaeota archaeon]
MFCQKCGSVLMPKKAEGKEKAALACRSCGHSAVNAEAAKITESIKKKAPHEERLFEPAAEDKITAPVTEAECPKCHNDKAYYWTRQTRAGDEGETKFHQCTSCKHKWREYG